MRGVAAALFAVLFVTRAQAGAWTEPAGHAQFILGTTYSNAGTSYDSAGAAKLPASFQKSWSSIWAEYGVTNNLTLILSPEYAWARTRDAAGFESRARDFAYGGGLRYRLLSKFGTLSLQATVKSAGAFDMSVAVGGKSGQQAELRLLYGTNFKIGRFTGFADFEAGERWVAGARPNETPIDITVGLHLTRRGMVMFQSFNVIAGGDARFPYSYYRSHKLELSWVSELGHGISVQSGVYFSPAGQNALDEKGAQLSLWLKL
jgi:hypothetical protein